MEKRGLTDRLREAGCTGSAGLFWADEMRVGLIGQVRRVWAPRGVKVVRKLEFEYEWAYLNLAVNGLEGWLYWDRTSNMKAESIVKVVEQWEAKDVDVIIWDRAPGHRGETFKQVEVVRIEQPPYSPELNPAERIFEELRRKVEGKVYGDIEKKKASVEEELRKLVAAPEKVKQLAGWSWIRQSVDSLCSSMALQ